jgi:hypothetical protein
MPSASGAIKLNASVQDIKLNASVQDFGRDFLRRAMPNSINVIFNITNVIPHQQLIRFELIRLIATLAIRKSAPTIETRMPMTDEMRPNRRHSIITRLRSVDDLFDVGSWCTEVGLDLGLHHRITCELDRPVTGSSVTTIAKPLRAIANNR